MQTFNKIATIFFLILISLVFDAREANSFSVPSSLSMDAFKINLVPSNVEANSVIKAKIETYSFDPDITYITWVLNGKTVKQGRGEKSIDFAVGDIGSNVSLSAYITTEKGAELVQSLNFKIAEIDLLWQAETTVPVFYKGKAEPVAGSNVKVAVISQGLGASKNLIYDWQRNYKIIADASGRGKDSFVFKFSNARDEEIIGVTVYGSNKDFSISKTITIKRKEPEIFLYEEHPLEGPLFGRVLPAEIGLTQEQTTIRAESYFFPKEDWSSLLYDWKMNDKQIEPLYAPNVIGLSLPEQKGGYSVVDVSVKNLNNKLQEVFNRIKINF